MSPTTYELEVNGTINATNFRGNGANITNLSLSNISGILPINNGGTGLSSFISNQILIGSSTSTITQSPNLIWDNTNNRLGIGSTIPQYTLDVIGNFNIKGNELKISNNNNGGVILNIQNLNDGVNSDSSIFLQNASGRSTGIVAFSRIYTDINYNANSAMLISNIYGDILISAGSNSTTGYNRLYASSIGPSPTIIFLVFG